MRSLRAIALTAAFVFASVAGAGAQTAPGAPAPQPLGRKLWIVAGGGFSMTRAGCAACSREGVFTNTGSIFFDVGGRVSPQVDAGIEAMFVRARYEGEDPILTTFIMAIAQFRPWKERGLYLRAGMGFGFVGHGINSPIGKQLAPPYSTNALGLSYGLGWIVRRERRWTLQASFAHHIAAIGELTTVSGIPIKNVVGNYWTSGAAIVIR